MAKNRRMRVGRDAAGQPHRSLPEDGHAVDTTGTRLLSRSRGLGVAIAMVAMAIVYVAYWPHDSTEVQQGTARYLVAWLLTASALAAFSFGPVTLLDTLVDLAAICLAGWMAVSLLAVADVSNLRLGINELGWWLAIAALVITVRRVTDRAAPAWMLLQLVVATALGVAIYGWHQSLIGFPQMVAQYRADPDATLRQLGIDAAPGTAMRIIFENRLYDGGPTGTFALANSMAAMLIGGWVAMVGVLIASWTRRGKIQRVIFMAAIVVVGSMLIAARSRSAVISLVLLAAWIILTHLGGRARLSGRADALRSLSLYWPRLLIAVAGLIASGIGVGYAFRNTEWIQQAPASLAIRFHYWLACFQMVSQSPWFGAGPGQFKARYESFRNAASTEQISDPHQFLLQTLTSGGIPSLALLLALLCLLICIYRRRTRQHNPLDDPDEAYRQTSGPDRHPGVVMGAMLGLAGVWLFGAALGQMPELHAAAIATVLAVGFATLSLSKDFASQGVHAELPVRSIAAYAAIAMGIDLSASGGMTVPGVSVIVWTLVAIAVPAQRTRHSRRCDGALVTTSLTFSWPAVMTGGIMIGLIVWYVLGVTPIERTKLLINRFEVAWSRGQVGLATETLEQAAEEDRWDPQPVLQLAAVYRSLAISQPEHRQRWESQWLAAEQRSAGRAGLDPVVMRQLGDNRLVYFQRFGEHSALVAADRWYARAVELAPSHESYAAQRAEILRALDDADAAALARRAAELSAAGGYYERSLDFTMILPAKHFGSSLRPLPVQRPASEVLAPLLVKVQ